MQRERREQERELSYPGLCQQYWEAGGGELWWIGHLDCGPAGRFPVRQAEELRTARASSNHAMRCSAVVQDFVRLSMEDGLKQCSLGSRPGTSGVELGLSDRSWAGEASSLAWQLPGFPPAPARFITPCANHHPHHTASTSTPSSPCMIPKPSSFSFVRSIGCGLSTID